MQPMGFYLGSVHCCCCCFHLWSGAESGSTRCACAKHRPLIRESAKCKNLYLWEICHVQHCWVVSNNVICVEKSNIKDTPMLFGDRRCGTLQEDPSVHGEIQAEVAGLHKEAKKEWTGFGLVCCESVLGPPMASWRRQQSAQESEHTVDILKEGVSVYRRERWRIFWLKRHMRR